MTDSSKPPGIAFRKVFLTKLSFETKPDFNPTGAIHLNVNATPEYRYNLSDDGKMLTSALKMVIDCEALIIIVEMTGHFEVEGEPNMPLKVFAEVNAFAMLIPFVREIVFNLTSRTRFSALVLPPINVISVVNQMKGKTADESAERSQHHNEPL